MAESIANFDLNGSGVFNQYLTTLDTATAVGVARGGERALMSALHFDGIQSFIAYALAESDIEKMNYKEALCWVMNKKSDYVFSFENVCECLGINSEYLRCGLLNAANTQSFEWRKVRRNF